MKFKFTRRLTLRGYQWYWKLVRRNGRTIAVSGEGYYNLSDAREMVELIIAESSSATIEVEHPAL